MWDELSTSHKSMHSHSHSLHGTLGIWARMSRTRSAGNKHKHTEVDDDDDDDAEESVGMATCWPIQRMQTEMSEVDDDRRARELINTVHWVARWGGKVEGEEEE